MVDEFEQDHKIHEKTDFEQWVFEYKLIMAQVQAEGNIGVYEMMLNTLLNNLEPYMEDSHRDKLETIKLMVDPTNPDINYHRVQEKELLATHVLNDLGAQFTPRRKAYIKKGVQKLWELYPPWEVTSGIQDQTDSEGPKES
jgi:hypothetical protein